ncbi:GGDEF domain-containing protein [Bradyrhizobium prioriisuperbiae]|uniref:GGDEF domain-containing protein n=1 Tax=Bradyrhizobium prioriisuperbiae TaxID=2854389 RepID=UPI0028E1D8CD|nr:GGDEF domain-containing protein [Bradyrhizobium prioritasuperba]
MTKTPPRPKSKPKGGSKSGSASKSGLKSATSAKPGRLGSDRAGGNPATGPKTASTGRGGGNAAPQTVLGHPDTAKLEVRLRKLTIQLTRAKARIANLEGVAETDVLLDVLNRRGFERELTRALAYIKRYQASGALIVLDVDRLKPINDAFGHAAGDAVLKGIVHVMQRHVRSSDMVGRLGGDEFAVLLWNLSEADALAKARALEDAIDRLTFVFRGHSIMSGASTGVTVLAGVDDAVAALERADLAMYERKRHRRETAAGISAPRELTR